MNYKREKEVVKNRVIKNQQRFFLLQLDKVLFFLIVGPFFSNTLHTYKTLIILNQCLFFYTCSSFTS